MKCANSSVVMWTKGICGRVLINRDLKIESAAMFVFIRSFTSVLAEKSSSNLRFYEKEFDS